MNIRTQGHLNCYLLVLPLVLAFISFSFTLTWYTRKAIVYHICLTNYTCFCTLPNHRISILTSLFPANHMISPTSSQPSNQLSLDLSTIVSQPNSIVGDHCKTLSDCCFPCPCYQNYIPCKSIKFPEFLSPVFRLRKTVFNLPKFFYKDLMC